MIKWILGSLHDRTMIIYIIDTNDLNRTSKWEVSISINMIKMDTPVPMLD